MDVSKSQRQRQVTKFPYLIELPTQIVLGLARRTLDLLRPAAPPLIPALVFLLFIPFAVFLSVSTGWIVWRSVATGWDSAVYLQYGQVCTSVSVLSH
jgi:hypothetical protein